MICNKCGAELPENSLFCLRCGNRLEQAPSQPQEQKSSSPFGTKNISDKHYSLEDIARQQRESNNEIGLDISSERPRRKKKRRPPSQGSQLPSAGISDKIDPLILAGLSAAQQTAATAENNASEESYSQQQPSPSEQTSGTETTSVRNDVVPDNQQETPQTEQIPPAAKAPVQNTAASSEKTAAPVSQQAKATFRYTITSPPVPLGLQRQVRLRLFGGNISAQIEELRRTYIEQKNKS